MKKLFRKPMVIALFTITIFFLYGCNKQKDIWADRSKIFVVFEDFEHFGPEPSKIEINVDDEEAINNVNFFYIYDGHEHLPNAYIIIEGVGRNYGSVDIGSKVVYHHLEKKFVSAGTVTLPGEYNIYYNFYKYGNSASQIVASVRVVINIEEGEDNN